MFSLLGNDNILHTTLKVSNFRFSSVISSEKPFLHNPDKTNHSYHWIILLPPEKMAVTLGLEMHFAFPFESCTRLCKKSTEDTATHPKNSKNLVNNIEAH